MSTSHHGTNSSLITLNPDCNRCGAITTWKNRDKVQCSSTNSSHSCVFTFVCRLKKKISSLKKNLTPPPRILRRGRGVLRRGRKLLNLISWKSRVLVYDTGIVQKVLLVSFIIVVKGNYSCMHNSPFVFSEIYLSKMSHTRTPHP
jgi:hypothetical protein